jgi:CheY-like chemotaxis protein
LRVLVIEDDQDSCELFTALLHESGANVVSAATAREALALLDTCDVDAIVADIGLADEDGQALMRRVRTREGERPHHVPALALTACARSDDRDRALASGFQMHVAKPVDADQFVVAVTTLAGQARAMKET